MSLTIFDDAELLASGAARRIEERLRQIQASGRTPRLVLTGGTIANDIYRQLSAAALDWSDVRFYWGDERFVAAGCADRNELQAREAFLDRLDVPADNIVAIDSTDEAADATAAADSYADRLPAEDFDLVLLGMGPDGHVASLFPGHEQLHTAAADTAAVLDSPKPPPQRVTMTFRRLNASYSVWFLVAGEAKADAVGQALLGADVDQIPAAGVRGVTETLWLLDHDAASRR